MSDFGLNLRELVSKGMEAIGNTASNIATSTRQKVNELNIGARKKELFEMLGEQVYIAWLNGEEFPDSMTEILRELLQLDQQSNHDDPGSPAAEEAQVQEAEVLPEETAEPMEPQESDGQEAPVSAADAEDHAEIPAIEIPEREKPEKTNEPLSSAINSLFEQMPPVDQLADKVNASLDEMGEQLKKFSDTFGKQLNDMTNDLLGKNDHRDE